MKADKWIDCIIVISCLITIVIAFSLTPAPRSPLTQAWLSDYPSSIELGDTADFTLHITGESNYLITIFVDNEDRVIVMAPNGGALGFSMSNIPLGKHRVTAEIADLNYKNTHELFFTVDVI
jgi:hypothetical protein